MPTKKYKIIDSITREPLMEYTSLVSAKYSNALALLKGYSKHGIEAIIFEENNPEPITREECEYLLK